MKSEKNKKSQLFLLFLGFSLHAAADCAAKTTLTPQGTQVERGSVGGQGCSVSIHPENPTHLLYREYTGNDTGLFMIFNSFGEGDSATGAREFYFFPRTRSADFLIDPRSNEIVLQMPNGDDFRFDPRTSRIKSMGRGQILVDPNIVAGNQGGVEILKYQGLWLDLGFALSHAPEQEPERTAVFHLLSGSTCSLKVKDLFLITPENSTLRFDDAALENYLASHCQ